VTVTGAAFADEVATMVEAGTPVQEETVALHIDVLGAVAVARVASSFVSEMSRSLGPISSASRSWATRG
jgi:type III secretory pathway component EscS